MYCYRVCTHCTVVLYVTKARQCSVISCTLTFWKPLSILVSCVVKVRGFLLQTVMKMESVKRCSDWLDDQPSWSFIGSQCRGLQLYRLDSGRGPSESAEPDRIGTWVIKNQFRSMSTSVSSSWPSLSAVICNHQNAFLVSSVTWDDSQLVRRVIAMTVKWQEMLHLQKLW